MLVSESAIELSIRSAIVRYQQYTGENPKFLYLGRSEKSRLSLVLSAKHNQAMEICSGMSLYNFAGLLVFGIIVICVDFDNHLRVS